MNNKNRINIALVILFFCTTFSGSVYAKSSELINIFFQRKFFISYEYCQWDYEEFLNNETFITDKGSLDGVHVKYKNLIFNDVFSYKFEAKYLNGFTDYVGGLNNSEDEYKSTTQNSITEISVDFGINYYLLDKAFLARTFMGYDYRVLHNPSNGNSGEYSRYATYKTIPFGIDINYLNSSEVIFLFTLQYNYLLSAHTESKLSEIHSSYTDIDNNQKRGKGYSASFGINYPFKLFSFELLFSYKKWKFEDSEKELSTITYDGNVSTQSYFEPENVTDVYSVNLGFVF